VSEPERWGSNYPTKSLVTKEVHAIELVGNDAAPYQSVVIKIPNFGTSGTPWVSYTSAGAATAATAFSFSNVFKDTLKNKRLRLLCGGGKAEIHGLRDGTTGKVIALNDVISALGTYDAALADIVPGTGSTVWAGQTFTKNSLPTSDDAIQFSTPSENTNSAANGFSTVQFFFILYTGMKATVTAYRAVESIELDNTPGTEAPRLTESASAQVCKKVTLWDRLRDASGGHGIPINWRAVGTAAGSFAATYLNQRQIQRVRGGPRIEMLA
jgi:hypothetical protein